MLLYEDDLDGKSWSIRNCISFQLGLGDTGEIRGRYRGDTGEELHQLAVGPVRRERRRAAVSASPRGSVGASGGASAVVRVRWGERWGERWQEPANGARPPASLWLWRTHALRPPPSTLRPRLSAFGPPPTTRYSLPPSISDCERAPPVDELLAVVLERLEDVQLELKVVLEELLDEQVHRDLVLGPALLQRVVLVRARAGVRRRARSGASPWPNLWPQRASARRALKVMYFSQSAGGVARKTSW